MKHEILKVKFKCFRDNVKITMQNIEHYCDMSGITYTYSVKHRFWPLKSVITAEFEGPRKYIEDVETYIRKAHGIS